MISLVEAALARRQQEVEGEPWRIPDPDEPEGDPCIRCSRTVTKLRRGLCVRCYQRDRRAT